MPQKKKTQIGDTREGRQTEIKKEERRHRRGKPVLPIHDIFSDPCLCRIDPDPDPAIFIIDFQEANEKSYFFQVFLFITF
jgi:hypothetical protein